ncbi:MAG TPA: hypothetical protein PLP25_07125, partial [Candidatus Limiplasma sp.]|nr:hypothetical protein [Candidatus Limiplasma sp.]
MGGKKKSRLPQKGIAFSGKFCYILYRWLQNAHKANGIIGTQFGCQTGIGALAQLVARYIRI